MHFGSSGSKVATCQYKCSKGSTLSARKSKCSKGTGRKYTLAAPARKSQLFSTSVLIKVCFSSSASKVATFQHKCSRGSTLLQRTSAVKEIHSAVHFLTCGLSFPYHFACFWHVLLHMCVMSSPSHIGLPQVLTDAQMALRDWPLVVCPQNASICSDVARCPQDCWTSAFSPCEITLNIFVKLYSNSS